MRILAIDTATEACSVALQNNTDVITRFEICPQQHSQRLLPMVDEVLSEAGLSLSQLDLLAFGRGPGSFTGVRIATGMIQGLAFGSDLPVAQISTLCAMAQQASTQTGAQHIAAAIDARMDEVYFATFHVRDGLLIEQIPEQVCTPAHAAQHCPDSSFKAVGTGWNAYPELVMKLSADNMVNILYPAAEHMLRPAQAAYREGRVVGAEEISPVYLRDTVTWKKLPGRE